MQYLYKEQGNHKIKINKEKRKLLYYKKIAESEIYNIIGFLDIQRLRKKKTEVADHNIKIGNILYPIEKIKNPKIHKKIYGYLAVENENCGVSYIALYGRKKWLLGLGLSPFIYLSPFATGSVIAASAIVISTIIVSQTIFSEHSEKTTEKKQVQKTIEKEKKQNGDSEGTIDYDGSVIINNNKNKRNEPEQNELPYYDMYYYSSFMLKKGEPLPLVNDATNNVYFEYVITDLNKNIFLDKWLAPGKAFEWVPVFSQGEYKLIMNINVWSMDKKTKFVGGTYDITITIQ